LLFRALEVSVLELDLSLLEEVSLGDDSALLSELEDGAEPLLFEEAGLDDFLA